MRHPNGQFLPAAKQGCPIATRTEGILGHPEVRRLWLLGRRARQLIDTYAVAVPHYTATLRRATPNSPESSRNTRPNSGPLVATTYRAEVFECSIGGSRALTSECQNYMDCYTSFERVYICSHHETAMRRSRDPIRKS